MNNYLLMILMSVTREGVDLRIKIKTTIGLGGGCVGEQRTQTYI